MSLSRTNFDKLDAVIQHMEAVDHYNTWLDKYSDQHYSEWLEQLANFGQGDDLINTDGQSFDEYLDSCYELYCYPDSNKLPG